MNEYFIEDLSKFKNFDILISKLDDYEDARRSIRIINKKMHNFENQKPEISKKVHY